MSITELLAVSFGGGLLVLGAYRYGRHYSLRLVDGDHRKLHSRPQYHGFYVVLWTLFPALLGGMLWAALDTVVIMHWIAAHLPAQIQSLPANELDLYLNDVVNLAAGKMASRAADASMMNAVHQFQHLQALSRLGLGMWVLGSMAIGMGFAISRLEKDFPARHRVERVLKWGLAASASVAVFTTLGILLSILFEALRFFERIPLHEFLFGLEWSPQMAIRADQVAAHGAFGVVPLLTGTFMVASIAMLVAVPLGLIIAIYLAEFARSRLRAWLKPLVEILAGIPTVVYGFFAALVVAPAVRGWGEALGLSVSSESALAAGVVMGIMIIPFVSSLADDAIHAVPQAMREGAYALGATQTETIVRVVLPAALPGIAGGVLLAVSRAIGETMIVVMAAGLAAKLTINPLDSVTTMTVQIVTLLVGDQAFDSPKTLAAFALGLMLFVMTLLLNVLALRIVKKYHERYE